ncbi:sensor histidine kinase [Marinicrinis lubricantis]|uniref:histidine kinase n=1 Tax=Marinicrinis lubricantis TaxID=2086470 RepID=A0ABW1IUM5_9BACL
MEDTKKNMSFDSNLSDETDALSATRAPLTLYVIIITFVTVLLQMMEDVDIWKAIAFVGMMVLHVLLYRNAKRMVAYSRLLYLILQGSIIFSSAFLMPIGMPAVLIGLIPALIGHSIVIYFRTISVVVLFFILFYFFSVVTLVIHGIQDIYLLISLLFFMNIVVIAYSLMFYKQVNARIRTQQFLRDLELAHEKVEELTIANERQRMARDLHDTLAQGLAGIIMQLEAIDAYLTSGNTERAKAIVRKSMSQARTTLAEARNAIDDLRSGSDRATDFAYAIQTEIQRFTAAAGISVNLDLHGTISISGRTTEHTLFILRESLSNVARHAQATEVKVALEGNNERFYMKIQDNGKGYNTDFIGQSTGHYGIAGMRERARIIGGRLNVTSTKEGTQVELRIDEFHEGGISDGV